MKKKDFKAFAEAIAVKTQASSEQKEENKEIVQKTEEKEIIVQQITDSSNKTEEIKESEKETEKENKDVKHQEKKDVEINEDGEERTRLRNKQKTKRGKREKDVEDKRYGHQIRVSDENNLVLDKLFFLIKTKVIEIDDDIVSKTDIMNYFLEKSFQSKEVRGYLEKQM